MSWKYTVEKIGTMVRDVERAVVRQSSPFGSVRYKIADLPREEASSPNLDDSGWSELPANRAWGQDREVTAWLRTSFTVPESWRSGRLMAHVRNVDCETIAYVDGRAVSSLDAHHFDVVVAQDIAPGKTYHLALEAYSGLGQRADHHRHLFIEGGQTPDHSLAEAEFRLVDPEIYAYSLDLTFAFETARNMDRNTREYGIALGAIEGSVDLLDFRQGLDSAAFAASARQAKEYLRTELYDKYKAGQHEPVLWGGGHSHIDTAWLWRLDHTRKKCERTFTTMLDLIDRYPDFVFSCSQAQHYQYIKEDNPGLLERIKAAVKKGAWAPVGGMWIEPDCNVISGESLVRQFLYGIRFTKEELGFRSRILWLPDVFGYSAALPQIMKKSGIDYFVTIKIFKNEVNRPPYQTFDWEGIDGSKVLAHYSPLGDYNAPIRPDLLRRTWEAYDQKHLTDSCLYLFGHGDGGGGVTSDQLDFAERAKDFLGSPRLKLASPEEFFKDLEHQVQGKRELPVWRGEIYLEWHRGTYTSQGRTKRFNREAEFLLQSTEQASALSHFLAGGQYDQKLLVDAWKLVLLNQFHDIIPGSSIHEVYEDSDRDYRQATTLAENALGAALSQIAGNIDAPVGSLLAFNPLSWPREDVAEVPALLGLPGQKATNLAGNEVTVVDLQGKLPSVGYSLLGSSKEAPAESELKAEVGRLENKFFTICLDDRGEISSLIDKRTGREVIDQNSYCKGNALLAFQDRPNNNDAWNIDLAYQDKMYAVDDLKSIQVIETGPTRAGVEVVRVVGQGRGSTIRQRILIYRDLPRIDFVTHVDWKERQTLLKAAFPVTINAMTATYDIQFGNVERPTHWNTTWDWARFEVCGHKWADLSEGDYGVSLLSDCKYGWDIKDNVMRLTLIKSPVYPDPQSDVGEHVFTYSLFPHEGTWRTAQTVRRAYELNAPIRLAQVGKGDGSLPAELSFATIDSPNIIVETIKKAEDDESIIVRVHDEYNQRGKARLTFPRPVRSAMSVNLIEDEPEGTDPSIDGDSLVFEYGPYEIRTFKVVLG